MTPPSAQAISPPPAPLAEPNAGWEEVGAASASGGGISDNESVSVYPSLAVAPDGTLYVAWEDWTSGDYEIFVRRWNGERWEEVGTGSASGGVSNNSSRSVDPLLSIAPEGTPYVAWEDYADGDYEIYVRHWNGESWEEVGPGSASGGGISDNQKWSTSPCLMAAPDGTFYAAWDDPTDGDDEIYVRRWRSQSRSREITRVFLPVISEAISIP